MLMLVFYILVISDRLRLESTLAEKLKEHREQEEQRLSSYLRRTEEIIDSRLPGTEFIRGAQQVESELTNAALNAKRFILATGGQSRLEKYLATIAQKVMDEGVSYTRVIFGDHIHHELCTHLCSLVDHPHVRIAHAPKETSGTVLVTDNVLIFTP